MLKYELMVVLQPTLEDEKKEAALEMIKAIIEKEGKVENVDLWGLRKLAYPIQKKNEGYYAVMIFEAAATLPKELDRRLKISDDVMRHMVVALDRK